MKREPWFVLLVAAFLTAASIGPARAALRNNATPSTRYGGGAAWDAVGQRLIGYGGYTGSYVGDVFSLTSYGPYGSFASVAPSGAAPATRLYPNMCWDAAGRRFIGFGGTNANGRLRDVFVLTVTAQGMTWSAPAVGGTTPDARSGAACVWDPVGQRAYFLGGRDSGGYFSDTLALDTAGGVFRWRALTAPNGPSARAYSQAVWDPVSSEVVLFGGTDGSNALSDLWFLRPNGDLGQWRRVVAAGVAPVARFAGTGVYDSSNRSMIMTMGETAGSAYTTRVQVLWLGDEPRLENPAISGIPPTARESTYAAWDQATRRIILTHGYDGARRSDGGVLTATASGFAWSGLSLGSCETAPVAPVLQSPINDAALAVCPATLNWGWGGGAWTWASLLTLNGRTYGPRTSTSLSVGTADVVPGRNTWSVQVLGCDGAVSPVAATSFQNPGAGPPVPVLTPVAPLDCDAGEANLTWTTASGVLYDVLLNGAPIATGLTAGSARVPSGSIYQADNTWSVTARACGQQVVSAPGAFVATGVAAPQASGLSAPLANAVGYCDETFTWAAGANPATTRYRLDILDANTGATIRSLTTGATTLALSGADRLPTGRYRAQVTALNCLGANPAVGGLRAFSVSNVPPVPLLLTPEADAWGAAYTVFSWGHAGAHPDVTFDVSVDGAPVVSDLPVDALGDETTYTLAAPLDHGNHDWQVRAEGCLGESVDSGLARAFQADGHAPSAFSLVSPADGGWVRGDAPVPLVFTESSETLEEGIGDVTCTATLDATFAGTSRPPVTQVLAGAPHFTHGFETDPVEFVSGGVGNEWGRTNATARTGTYSMAVAADGQYANNTSSTLTSARAYPITRANALQFYIRGTTDNCCDTLDVQVGTDAQGYTTVGNLNQDYANWTLITANLAAYVGQSVQIRFRFVSNGNTTDVGYRIDDLTIAGLPLADGAHTWGVTCTDGAGNARVSTPPSFNLGVDTVNPTAPGLVTPVLNGFVNAARPTFTWTAGTDALSGVAGYEVLIDGALASGPQILAPAPLAFTALQDLLEGAHRYSVRTVDRAGGRMASLDRAFTVDLTPPATPVVVGPSGLSDDLAGRRYCFENAADNRSGICGYRLWVDGAIEFDRIAVPGAQRGADGCVDGLSFLPDGARTWAVASIDCAGNVSAPSAPVDFVLETMPPAAFTATDPPNGTTVNTVSPLFCWNATTDAGSGVDHYELLVDGQVSLAVPPVAENGIVCSRPAAPLVNGAHTWAVRAVDVAENRVTATGMPWAVTVNRDVTAPTCVIDSPAAGALAGCVDYRFAGTADDLEANGRRGSGIARVEYQLDGVGGPWLAAELGGSERNRSWTASWNGQNGEHTLTCRATDREGNVQAVPTSRVFRVDCVGPRAFAVLTPAENANVSACPTLAWAATTDELSALAGYEVLIDGRPPLAVAPNLTRRTLAGDECLAGGVHTVTIRARDALGNATDTAPRAFVVDTTGPVAFSLAGQAPVDNAGFTSAAQVTLTWNPSADLGGGLDPAPYQVLFDGQPLGARRAQTQYIVVDPADGPHTWTVVARDVFGNETSANTPAPLGRFTVDRTGPDAGTVRSLAIDALDVPARPGVHAGQPQDTGLDVGAGESVRVVAEGMLCFADDASCNPRIGGGGCYGPGGAEPAPANASRFYAHLPFGALYAIVGGHPEAPVVPNAAGVVVAPFAGRLFIGVNDNDTYNCRSRWLDVAVLANAGYNLVAPAHGTFTRETRPLFRWTPVTDAGIGVARLSLVVDGRVVAGDIAADATSFTLPANSPLVEGDHRWQIAADDLLGNQSRSDEFTLRVDLTPPEPFDVTTPREGEVVDRAQPELCWGATRDQGAGLAHWLVEVDGEYDGAQYPDARTCLLPSSPLPDGRHCFAVVAQDALLWERRSQTAHCFTVDTAPPAAFALLTPDAGLSFNSRPEFCWSPSSDAGTGLVRYEVYLSGNRLGVVDPQTTCFRPDAPIPNGDHVWFVRAVDGAGATTTSEQRPLRIERDLTPPDVRVVTPAADTLHGELGIPVGCLADDGARGTGVVGVQIESPAGGAPRAGTLDPASGLWRATWPVAADGQATVCCRATDGEGNRNPDTGAQARACVTVRTDVSPPGRFALTAPLAGRFVSARATFSWTASADAPAGIAGYRLNIQGPSGLRTIDAGVRTTYTLSAQEALLDGAHTATVTAIDALGHERPADAPESFEVDGTAPQVVTLLSPDADAALSDASPVLCFTAGVDLGAAGLCGHRVTLDGQDRDVSAETTCLPVGPLARGDHAFTVAAVDCAGNVGPVAPLHAFRVDLTPPPAPTLVNPDDGAFVVAPVAVRWTEVQDVAGVDHTGLHTYRLEVDGESADVPAATPTARWPDDFPAAPGRVLEGEHTVRVAGVDTAGNVGTFSAPRRFVVDATAPEGLVLLSPTDGALLRDAPLVRWTPPRDSASGLCSYTLEIDGEARALPPEDTEAALPVLTDGPHELYLTAADCVGLAATVSAAFVLDTTPPAEARLVAPDDEACLAADGVELRWQPGADATSGLVAQTLWVDGLSVADLAADASSHPLPPIAHDGPHTWGIRGRDGAGHESALVERTITLDRRAPTCRFVRSERTADGALALVLTAEDQGCGLASVEASVDGADPEVLQAEAGLYTFALPAGAPRDLAATCRVRDRAGASGTARTTLVFDPCTAPGDCPLGGPCGTPRPEGEACEDGDACTTGDACRAGRCVGPPLDCESPPADECQGDAARHFEGPGACVAGGCVYPSRLEACVREAEVCAGEIGRCEGGGCVYEPAALGAACEDGTACTSGDACDGAGACVRGEVRACDAPPPPRCVDAHTSWVHSAVGACLQDVCTYAGEVRACPAGCDPATGLCIGGDPCDGVACVIPPGPCFETPGACADGACRYTARPAGTLCDAGDACREPSSCDDVGNCLPGAARRCDDTPAAECLDASTSQTFVGVCLDDGCAALAVETRCPAGCDATTGRCLGGDCDGVTCDSPPGACFEARGACVAGACVYRPADADTQCLDDDPCTESDRCDGTGRCLGGRPLACETPPPPECLDASTRRGFLPDGRCTDGECSYEPVDTECPYGCDAVSGQCLPEPCAGKTCETPPDACHLSAGRCESGGCVYPVAPAGTPCDDGDACTAQDACGGDGACRGEATPCPLPDPRCGDDGRLLVAVAGACESGGCLYETEQRDCPNGCEDGACRVADAGPAPDQGDKVDLGADATFEDPDAESAAHDAALEDREAGAGHQSRPDGSASAVTSGGGCGCRTAGPSITPWPWLPFLAWPVVRRRRRRG